MSPGSWEMADKAQSEPTMEEILASIRKIIADDGDTSRSAPAQSASSAPSVDVNVTDDDDGFDDLSLDDVRAEDDADQHGLKAHGDPDFDLMSDEDSSGSLSGVDDDMFDDLAAEEEAPIQPAFGAPAAAPSPAAQIEDELEDFDFGSLDGDEDTGASSEPEFEQSAPAWADTPSVGDDASEEWAPHTEEAAGSVADDLTGSAPQPEPEAAPQPEAVAEPEPVMQSAPEPEYEPVAPEIEEPALAAAMTESPSSNAPDNKPQASDSGLTDERIAGAAASALGKLMVKQSAAAEDDTNPNTLDGLMKELLRPMIKEWLDANLPSIVERKVEEEVQRIARMAR